MDTLDSLIQGDPNLPSLAYQAHENAPICLPWARKPIVLGTGLESSVAANSDDQTVAFRPSAFDRKPAAYQFQGTGNANSFRQSASSHSSSSYEHMDMKATFSAGGSVLGVSGRGQFTKDVCANRDSSKISVQASIRVGWITFSTFPRLSSQSLSLLRRSPAAFHHTYGDYFLSALSLGADTSTFLSTSSNVDLKSEMRDIQVKAKFLGASKTVFADHLDTQAVATMCDISYIGFDSLSEYQQNERAMNRGAYERIKVDATRNVADGIRLVDRMKEALGGVGLDCERALTEAEMEDVCMSGAVVEVMFLPYSGLRDYVAATSIGFLTSQLDDLGQ
ncbi:hypothetical protein DXG03_007456 [Asterophora parasitica]|uniref:Uncharacterized protein n=1 Tax=Asterophora parasitica TaxID=117018 RepID=A0A9P7G6T6_9AGAR|nr:hypothetical protein DXG03_007456 [Asterophora parasitica]